MVSFIIPAYNEERLLAATLAAIQAAGDGSAEEYEVVVADDASTDQTASIARRHGARVVTVAHRQIAATRNAGAKAASGDILIFVDADTVVNEKVVRAAIAAVREGAAGGGAAVAFDGRVPLYARLLLPLLVCSFRVASLAAGCFVFCSRHAFETAGGFDESYFGAEEIAFSYALKRQGKFVVLRHSVVTSGRKLRTYSGGELLAMLGRLALRGPKSVRQRPGMELWYADRREDPRDEA